MNAHGRTRFLKGVARGFGGAMLFSLPLYMTMEMWWLGFYIDPWRLALLLLTGVPLLVGLAYVSGIEKTPSLRDALLGGLTAYGIGIVCSAVVLAVLALIWFGDPLSDVVGKIGVQALPAGIGASLARGQLGGGGQRSNGSGESSGEEGQSAGDGGSPSGGRRQSAGGSYPFELFLMLGGAVYVAFNVAATQEMNLLAYTIGPWHVLGALLFTILMMHAFVYAMEFAGTPMITPDQPWWSLLLRYTIPGYVVAFGTSAFLLWVFGRHGGALDWIVMRSIILAVPAGLGAAAARLIV